MDLIEAMEEMERSGPLLPAAQRRPTAAAAVASARASNAAAGVIGAASWDFVLQQTAFVQTRLKVLWAAKHRGDPSSPNSTTSSVHVPFSWVLSKVNQITME